MAKRYSQPQIGSPIDWGNPRAKGLVYAWVPAISRLTKFGAVGRYVNRQGVGSNTNGSSTYEFMNTAPVFDLNECSLTAILTPQGVAAGSSYAVACGQNASGNPLFMIGQGPTSNQLGFRTRDSANVDVVTAGTSADWANGLTTVVSGTRSKTAALQRVFAAGKQVASTSVGTAAATTFDRFAIGCLLRSSAALYWSGTTNLVLIHNRALTNDDEEELADNPWQVWVPTNRQFFVSSAGGGGVTISCTVGNAVAAGPNASINQSVTISATPGAAVADGVTARLNVGISAGVGNAVAAGTNARQNISVAAGVGNAVAAGVSAAITTSGGTTISCSVGNAAASGVNAAVNVSIRTTTGNAVAAGTNAGLNVSIPAGVGNAVASGVQALLPISIRAIVGDAIASGVQATCQFSDPESTPPTSYYRRVAGSILAGRFTGVDNAIFLRIARRRGR